MLRPLRLGLYHRYFGGNLDEGWTRFVFDKWEFPYTRVEADEIRKGGLRERYDIIMFPDDELRFIMGSEQREAGLFPGGGNYPPEYRKGIGSEGVQALREFVRTGGSLVLIDGATSLATEAFGIPVRDALKGLSTKEFFAPGSTLRIKLDPTQPLAYGMPRDALVLFFDSVAFNVGNSLSNGNIAVVGQYGDRDLLRGGWLDGEKHLVRKAALLDVGYGQGRIALIGFRATAPRTNPWHLQSAVQRALSRGGQRRRVDGSLGRSTVNTGDSRPGAWARREWPVHAEQGPDRGARRPAGKARRPRIPGVFEGGVTQPAGMPRPRGGP